MIAVSDRMEFFNGSRWKELKDWKEGEKILQLNYNGTAEMVGGAVKDVGEVEMYKYESTVNDFIVSGDCGVVRKSRKLSKEGVFGEPWKSLVVFDGVPIKDVSGVSGLSGVPIAFEYEGGLLVISEVTVVVAMCIFNRVSKIDFDEGEIEVGLKCNAEYEYLSSVLKRYGISHDMYYREIEKKERLCVSFSYKEVSGLFFQRREESVKAGFVREYVLPESFLGSLTKDVSVRAAEAFYGLNNISAKSDGSFDIRIKSNCDLVQFLFSSNGVNCRAGVNGRNVYVKADKNLGTLYFAKSLRGIVAENGCSVAVPSGMVVLRHNGKLSMFQVCKLDRRVNIWNL